MRKLWIAVLLGGLASPAFAEWVPVASNEKVDVYFDPATKTRSADGKGRIQALSNYKHVDPKAKGPVVQSFVQVLAFECNRDTTQVISATLYGGPNATGPILLKQNDLQPARLVQPDSLPKKIFDHFCATKP
jgi:hypothetical protein